MSVRDKPIYLSTDVYRALWLISKATPARGESEIRTMTPDEIADAYLRGEIAKDHPEIFEHLQREDKATKDLIATLQKK